MGVFNDRALWDHYQKLLSNQWADCEVNDEQIIYKSCGRLNRRFDIVVPESVDLSGLSDHNVLILGAADVQSQVLNKLPRIVECSHGLNMDIIVPIKDTKIRFFAGGSLYGLLLNPNVGDLCVEGAHNVRIKILKPALEAGCLKGLVLKTTPCIQIILNNRQSGTEIPDPSFLGIEYDECLRSVHLISSTAPDKQTAPIWTRAGKIRPIIK